LINSSVKEQLESVTPKKEEKKDISNYGTMDATVYIRPGFFRICPRVYLYSAGNKLGELQFSHKNHKYRVYTSKLKIIPDTYHFITVKYAITDGLGKSAIETKIDNKLYFEIKANEEKPFKIIVI